MKEKFEELLKLIQRSLKSVGFERRGPRFYIQSGENYGLIGFQKSTKSSSQQILFTINLGVTSAELRRFQGARLVKNLSIEECHWKERIGFILPQQRDVWWTLGPSTSVSELAAEIIFDLSAAGVPEVLRHITDAQLMDEWLTGKSAGLTEMQRYIFLTVLLKTHKSSRLTEMIEEFEKYSVSRSLQSQFDYHRKKLESHT